MLRVRKTGSTPLAWLYAALVVYASLYPFTGWRDQGIAWWSFVGAPVPRYWSGFDVVINLLGYLPFGALLLLQLVHSRLRRWAVLWAVFIAAALSFSLEALQTLLPMRVASREDWLLNTLGAALGAGAALGLVKRGVLSSWARWRARWCVPGAHGALVLLLLWPVALLFPPAVPFGLGQVAERLQAQLALWAQGVWWWPQWLGGTLSEPDWELVPMGPWIQSVCVFLGLLIPSLLGFSVLRSVQRRLLFVPAFFLLGAGVTGLSAALSWGPLHAWAWLDAPVQVGMGVALLLALLLAAAPARMSVGLLLLGLGLHLGLLNHAAETPYFTQTLQEWEQGRFIRFHGLAQWVGWLWPYATLAYVFSRIWRRGL